MKREGGLHIGEGLLIGITLADNAPFYTQRVGDVTIRVLFNDDLDLRMDPPVPNRTSPLF